MDFEALRTAIAKAEIETNLAEQEISEWRREQSLQRTGPDSQRSRRIAHLKASPLGKLDWNRQFVSPLAEVREGNTLFLTPQSLFRGEESFHKGTEAREAALEAEKRKLLATLEAKIETVKAKVKRKEKAKVEALKAEILAGNRREDELKAALDRSKAAELQLKAQLQALQSSPCRAGRGREANEVATELERERKRREEAESAYRTAALELNQERIRLQEASEGPDQAALFALEDTIQRLTQENHSLFALHKSDQEVIKRLQTRIDSTLTERTTARSRSPLLPSGKADSAPGKIEEMRKFYEEKCAGLRKELERWRDKAALLVSRYRGKLGRLREDWRTVKEEVEEYRREVQVELERKGAYSYRRHR